MDSNGLQWTLKDSNGLQWTPLDSNGLHWTLMDSPLFHSELSDFCEALPDPLRIPQPGSIRLSRMRPLPPGDPVHRSDLLQALVTQVSFFYCYLIIIVCITIIVNDCYYRHYCCCCCHSSYCCCYYLFYYIPYMECSSSDVHLRLKSNALTVCS